MDPKLSLTWKGAEEEAAYLSDRCRTACRTSGRTTHMGSVLTPRDRVQLQQKACFFALHILTAKADKRAYNILDETALC